MARFRWVVLCRGADGWERYNVFFRRWENADTYRCMVILWRGLWATWQQDTDVVRIVRFTHDYDDDDWAV